MMYAPNRPNESPQIAQLAYALADESARTALWALAWRKTEDGWCDIRPRHGDEEVTAALGRAVTYLAARGLLMRHPENATLVKLVKEGSDDAPTPA